MHPISSRTLSSSRDRGFVATSLGLALCLGLGLGALAPRPVHAASLEAVPVPHSTLQGNVPRLLQALEFLGAPLPSNTLREIQSAQRDSDSARIQTALDAHVAFAITLNPEARVKVTRGPAASTGLRAQQGGYKPVLLKIINQSTVTQELQISSPQAGPVYAGMTPLSAFRLQREPLRETRVAASDTNRFLDLSLYRNPPMTPELSGLPLEYALALVYSRDAGRREATFTFSIGENSQDLGFRGETPAIVEAAPAIPVLLNILDIDGQPATARLVFRDAQGHVLPPQAKRLAPDFYFQPQLYRRHGEFVELPPGALTVEYSRGPEYRVLRHSFRVEPAAQNRLSLRLERWIDPSKSGYYSGDHHIHGAGCAHYTQPTEGVSPEDLFRQVDGEGLNVGCVLTWGPCFDYQRRFFSPSIHLLSKPRTLLKYDLEISGFGSEAHGHVCLLNLKNQEYPGSHGGKSVGWPKWTLPVLQWAKAQGGYTGYAHSGSGLEIHPAKASERLIKSYDANHDGVLTPTECAHKLLPLRFEEMDRDHDALLTQSELMSAHDAAAESLPNLAIPEMNGVGAMEIAVTTALGACDFISAMDTPRIAEWNMWYHLMNCGFPLKASGETDFPCMSGDRVGQGRVYVHLGKIESIDFAAWCKALAAGQSYVSDGFAHALDFRVNDVAPGPDIVRLPKPGEVRIVTRTAFAPETPATIAQGQRDLPISRRWIGDTVTHHGSPTDALKPGGTRRLEVIVNGDVAATHPIPADGKVHEWTLTVPVPRSGWIALRHFPQLHTNPVRVEVAGAPIRASRSSALWCAETIRQLWRNRGDRLPPAEKQAARLAYDEALRIFEQIAAESAE